MNTERDLESCFIIHTRPYLETSLLVELFSLNYGRISLIARGAKKQKSALKARLQPFVPLKITMKKGRGTLWYLKDCQSQGLGYSFGTPEIFCATYLNELLYYLFKNEEGSSTLFAQYMQALGSIAGQGGELGSALRSFELALLDALGYGIEFADSASGSFRQNAYYSFTPSGGFSPSPDSSGQVFSGAVLNDLRRGEYSLTFEHARAIRDITGQAIGNLLGNRSIKSRNLYLKYKESASLQDAPTPP